MRYKVSLPPPIKSLAEWQLENYRQDKKQLEQLEMDMIRHPIANYDYFSGSRGSPGENRPTENNAILILSAPYLQRIGMGVQAVEFALRGIEKTDLQLVTLVYWQKSKNVEGASMECNVSKSSAYRRINDILVRIAYGMGYLKFTDMKG